MHLLSKEEITAIFNCSVLYEKKSFFVINSKTKEYDVDREYQSIIEYASHIEDAYKRGKTIVVKNLENYNEKLALESLRHGNLVDLHMYIVPPNGHDSFGFHQDDCDVNILMIFGEKKFELKQRNGETKIYLLEEGQHLQIPRSCYHRAVPKGASCLLSFGIRGSSSYPIGSFFENLATS